MLYRKWSANDNLQDAIAAATGGLQYAYLTDESRLIELSLSMLQKQHYGKLITKVLKT
jgi:hypothetical protein